MSKNDITGDSLRSRELSAEGKERWDLIFTKKPDATVMIPAPAVCQSCGTRHAAPTTGQVANICILCHGTLSPLEGI